MASHTLSLPPVTLSPSHGYSISTKCGSSLTLPKFQGNKTWGGSRRRGREERVVKRDNFQNNLYPNFTRLSRKLSPFMVVGRKIEEEDVSAKENSTPGTSSTSFLSFLCPLLKLLSGGDAAAPRVRILEVTTTGLASLSRLPWGSRVSQNPKVVERDEGEGEGEPLKMLQLYEFEACPFCRRVREALTELDLSAEVYPCPKNSVEHRKKVLELGGKDQYPFFVDPNTNTTMYESGDIVKYLFRVYGGESNPTFGLLESTPITGWMPTLLRAGRGMIRYPSSTGGETERERGRPEAPLELYSYENNQFARLVREALCELEIPYILRSAGKGSRRRERLRELSGSTQVPYLVDPNTGVNMGESEAIVEYLFRTYGTQSHPVIS